MPLTSQDYCGVIASRYYRGRRLYDQLRGSRQQEPLYAVLGDVSSEALRVALHCHPQLATRSAKRIQVERSIGRDGGSGSTS